MNLPKVQPKISGKACSVEAKIQQEKRISIHSLAVQMFGNCLLDAEETVTARLAWTLVTGQTKYVRGGRPRWAGKETSLPAKAFFVGGHVFVNLPTGYGKSLKVHCLPIVAHVLQNKPRGSSTVVVISPPHQSGSVSRNPSSAA